MLRTGEEALRSTRVLHQCAVVSQKLSFLKYDYLAFSFDPNMHVQNAVVKINISITQANYAFGQGPHGLRTATSAKDKSGVKEWREEWEIIHILMISSFSSSSTTKSSVVLDLTSLKTVAENLPHYKHLHGFPLQTCFPLFTIFLSVWVHRPPTVSGSLAGEKWQMKLGLLPYMNIN